MSSVVGGLFDRLLGGSPLCVINQRNNCMLCSGSCLTSSLLLLAHMLQVRLLVAAAGLKLLQLKRVRMGGFVMPQDLQPGQYM